jgi:hypothetical protein
VADVSESTARIELFTRAGAVGTHDRLLEAIERVRAIEAESRVADCHIGTWNKQIVLDNGGLDRNREVRKRVEAFESWADEHGVSLYPFFEERTRGSLAIDGERTVLVLPVICLAVYEGETLSELFPRAAGEVTYTVAEGLTALETGVTGLTLLDTEE